MLRIASYESHGSNGMTVGQNVYDVITRYKMGVVGGWSVTVQNCI